MSTQKTDNAVGACTEEIEVLTLEDSGPLREEHQFCCGACQVTIPSYLQAALLVIWCRAWLKVIETHLNVVEWGCFMNAGGLINILPGKAFFVCIANLTAKLGNLSKFTTVASASNAL